MRAKALVNSLLLLIPSFFSSSALAEEKYSSLNMTRGVTPISRDVYDLHMIIFYICVAIGIIVFGVLAYALIMHRKSRGVKAAQFHENTVVEILWAVIPFIILIVMAIPATKVLIDMKDTSKADVTIKVTGYQWRWQYEYLNEGIAFFSNLATPLDQIHNKAPKGKWYLLDVDNPLVLPIHRKIRFLITSNDVIHSWWVPDLGFKKDAVPGFIHDNWAYIEKPGIYRGQCAELCGANHGFMPIVIEAVSPEDYDKWVASKTQAKAESAKAAAAALNKTFTKEELMQTGEKEYNKICAACHKPDGSGMPPTFPALIGGKIVIGPVNDHIKIVLNGVPGTSMQAFGSQLSDLEIAAIVTYERNAWGNDNQSKYGKNAGGIVQPTDVKALR
ncbi:MAG: cytochrome c oxidase subunit II [Legionellales bacterium]|nr:cytochrome c oxidase subunit II [Legionellales bacterium]